MAENSIQPESNPPKGAIDLMYFPPEGPKGASPCHESIEPAIALKKECGLEYVFVTQCKQWSCDRRIYCDNACLDDILRYTLPYPEHFIGMGGYNPLDITDSARVAETGIREYGFRGIYVHPGSFGITPGDSRMYPLYVKALEWDVPVILDVSPLPGDALAVRAVDIERVAADFGGLNLVIAGSQWTSIEMLRLIENIATLYFCFDTPALQTLAVRTLVSNREGQTRCMWGSNGLSWREALDPLVSLQSPERSALLRDNPMRVFGLDRHPKREPMPFTQAEQPPMHFAE